MALRLSLLFATLALAGCASSDPSPEHAGCPELAERAIGLRLESRLEHVPDLEREGHRAALARALTPTYLAACQRMTASQRSCWGNADSADDVAACGLPTNEDATAIVRTLGGPVTEEN